MNWELDVNKKKFLEGLISKFHIQTPSDWGKVTTRDIRKAGGAGLLHIYNSSLFTCLKSLYPEIEWKQEWFRFQKHWSCFEKQKKFLQEIEKKYNIKKHSDWGYITCDIINKEGGRSLFENHKSIQSILKHNFPQINWKEEWWNRYPRGYWENEANKVNILEKIKTNLGIQNPRDWKKCTANDFKKHGGITLLRLYNNSIFKCLQSIYRDVPWQKEWFSILKYPKAHWDSLNNCRNFLDQIAINYHIQKSSDWRRVSASLIRKRGGAGLLAKYGNSIRGVLNITFPHQNWENLSEPHLKLLHFIK